MIKKEKIIPILSVLIIGGVSGHHIDDLIEQYNIQNEPIVEYTRYPLVKEFEIMQNCISNSKNPLPINLYKKKKDICACALEKTELEYSYNQYLPYDDVFLNIFEKKANECFTE